MLPYAMERGGTPDGKIVFAKAFGFSNLSNEAPATQTTQYPIGSVVKTFTSGLIGVLEEEGLVSLSTPVAEYLDELELGSQDAEHNLTITNLLSQTSGLADLSGSLAFFPVPEQGDVVPRLAQFPMACRVGDCWRYNNLNFILLDAIVERATGRSKATLLEDRLFKPAGMGNSLSSTISFDRSPNAASGYAQVEGEAQPTATELVFGEHVYATASDLARWIDLWMRDGGGVIPPNYVNQAISMQAISDGSPPSSDDPGAYLSGYGYGWRIRSRYGDYQVGHGGNENGFSSQVLFVPAKKVGVVALTNQQNSILPYIANDILLRRMLGQEKIAVSSYPVQVQSAAKLIDASDTQLDINREAPPSLEPSSLTGRYAAPGYGQLSIAFNRGVLTLTTPAAQFVLLHRSNDTYGLGSTQPLPIGINSEFFEIQFQESALTANIAAQPVQFRKAE